MEGVHDWAMSATTAAAFHETFIRKYDGLTVQDAGYLSRVDEVSRWMTRNYMKPHRRLTNQEIIDQVEAGKSIGHELFGEYSGKKDYLECLQDPAFWEAVDAEEERLLRGRSEYGVFNTTPKREKIDTSFGDRVKNKRVIAFLPAVLRTLEHRWLGYLNLDGLCERDNLSLIHI